MIPFVVLLAAGRVALGLAPILAAGPTSRLLGFPQEHDNATARLMGRLFGVRDIGLGALALLGVLGWVPLEVALLLNAAHDAGDALVIGVPLLRDGAKGGEVPSLGMAVAGGSLWVVAWALL